jgi:hypothetical protein
MKRPKRVRGGIMLTALLFVLVFSCSCLFLLEDVELTKEYVEASKTSEKCEMMIFLARDYAKKSPDKKRTLQTSIGEITYSVNTNGYITYRIKLIGKELQPAIIEHWEKTSGNEN